MKTIYNLFLSNIRISWSLLLKFPSLWVITLQWEISMSKNSFLFGPRSSKSLCSTFIYRVSEHAQTKKFGLRNKGARKKKFFFLKIEKNAWNVLNQKIMQKYFVTFLQWYPVKTFQSSFPLEQFFFSFSKSSISGFSCFKIASANSSGGGSRS